MLRVDNLSIDIEPTNRCNAKCHFCPRDATPHQGLMTPEVFDQTLARTIEMVDAVKLTLDTQVRVSLCGLGEPLLNRHTPDFVKRVRDAGLTCWLASNAALLDERRGRALLDAGLQGIMINVGDHDEDYDEVYQLPFEKTKENILRFAEMAGDACEVWIVLVDYRRDKAHIAEMRSYWSAHGLTRFVDFDIINRGGALFVDHMQFETLPELEAARGALNESGSEAVCIAPFRYMFVGYDGQYYLCCSDWKKEAPLGSVFEASFTDVFEAKLEHVTSREPVCKTCNHDPVNQLTEELRAINSGELEETAGDALITEMAELSDTYLSAVEQLAPGVRERVASKPPTRRLIPVSTL